MCDARIKAGREEIARSPEGNWREDVLFELQQAVAAFHFAQGQMRECDRKLEAYLAALPDRSGKLKTKKKRKDGKPRGNEPQMNLKGERKRSCGADLTSIDGIGTISALTIVSEIGTDMRKFADENHFACRLGLGGNENTSGGRRVRGPKRKVKTRVADVLRMAPAAF